MAEPHSHVLQVYIRTTPDRLWQALTDGEMSKQYYFGSAVESTWEKGASFRNVNADGSVMIEGKILEIDKPRKLVTTFIPRWDPTATGDPGWKVTWEITQLGDACKLTLVHDGLVKGSPEATGTFDGWSKILSGIKTLLETGQPLTIEEPAG
jgi:uncharacterized protein YndB with AHSA1/START domain